MDLGGPARTLTLSHVGRVKHVTDAANNCYLCPNSYKQHCQTWDHHGTCARDPKQSEGPSDGRDSLRGLMFVTKRLPHGPMTLARDPKQLQVDLTRAPMEFWKSLW